ncbi:hypothetical protein B0T17DRAFT_82645 [Bombardia bombarda]|uniref:Uncharacterized protein n=1 Tax=Bombardia bombarda TaxID=252184 RepID=A0AA39XNX6_9PEZI|nr:hypothetical protein B0T17DRAFT_82645 [Bombardia bombarda]
MILESQKGRGRDFLSALVNSIGPKPPLCRLHHRNVELPRPWSTPLHELFPLMLLITKSNDMFRAENLFQQHLGYRCLRPGDPATKLAASKLLPSYGADPNFESEPGTFSNLYIESATSLAKALFWPECAKELIRHGANYWDNLDGFTLRHPPLSYQAWPLINLAEGNLDRFGVTTLKPADILDMFRCMVEVGARGFDQKLLSYAFLVAVEYTHPFRPGPRGDGGPSRATAERPPELMANDHLLKVANYLLKSGLKLCRPLQIIYRQGGYRGSGTGITAGVLDGRRRHRFELLVAGGSCRGGSA